MVEEEDYDATRFLSKLAQDSFFEDLEKKFLAERYITYDRAAYPLLYDQIEARGWNALLQRPVRDTFPGEIAREFYANAHFAEAKEAAWVRGVEVRFTPDAINEFYNIEWPVGQKDETDDLFRRGEIEDENIAQMKGFLSVNNMDTYELLRQSQLKREAKAWAVVMCSHLAPTSFNTTYSDKRVPLLYALTKGLKFNLGKVIHARLRSTIDHTSTKQKSFIFPYLIFGLCKNAGVDFGVMQEVCKLGTPIGNHSICATLGLTYQNYAPRPNPPAGNYAPRPNPPAGRVQRVPREFERRLDALERKFMIHHEYTPKI
ncbi:hypothetical protein ACJIZ3_008686 [Penstemon smallii]|uniref:Putative plant transposon protein domain-containing protein n=1 Tax=Penstemon smallii TaxID=265156 RepID=A0ABD3TBQ3_9LAMI